MMPLATNAPLGGHKPFWGNFFLFENGDDFAILDPINLKTIYATRDELAPLISSTPPTKQSIALENLLHTEGLSRQSELSLRELLTKKITESSTNFVPKRFGGLRIVLTRKCNMDCSYCYVATNDGSADMTENELREGLEFLFLENIGQDVVWIQWFGGEPTIRFDLIELGDKIIAEMQEKYHVQNVHKTMVTNGLKITNAQLDYLEREEYGVGISIDGVPGLNDQARMMLNGSSADSRVINNIKRYREREIRVGINFTPTAANIVELPSFIDYCIDELDVNFIYVNFPIPVTGFWPVSGTDFAEALFEGRRRALLKGGELYSGIDRVISGINSQTPIVYDHIEVIDGIIGALLPKSLVSLSEINFENPELVFPLDTVRTDRSVLKNIVKEVAPSNKCDRCPAIGVCGGPQRNDVLLRNTNEPDKEFCAFCEKALEKAIWSEPEF